MQRPVSIGLVESCRRREGQTEANPSGEEPRTGPKPKVKSLDIPKRLIVWAWGHAAPRRSFTAAPATPPVVLGDAAGQHRTLRFQVLPDHDQAELVEAAERGQAGPTAR
jgi:hypothetical protein